MKLVFIGNHSPRKIGDVVTFETRDEIRTANWYLANNIARLCECDDKKSTGCADCDEKAKAKLNTVVENVEVVTPEVITPKVVTPKKKK